MADRNKSANPFAPPQQSLYNPLPKDDYTISINPYDKGALKSDIQRAMYEGIDTPMAQPDGAPENSYITEIDSGQAKAEDLLKSDPRVKQDIVDLANDVYKVDLSGKSNEEVTSWFLDNSRFNENSLFFGAIPDYFKSRDLDPQLKEKYKRTSQLFDRLPWFEGGVGETLKSAGKGIGADVAAGMAAGGPIGAAGAGLSTAGNILVRGTGKALQHIGKNVLLGSAGTEAAKLAAAKVAAKQGTGKEAFWSAARAGAGREAGAGAAWGGGQSLAIQGRDVNLGKQEDISLTDVAIGAGAGALIGGGIGAPLHGVSSFGPFAQYSQAFDKLYNTKLPQFNPNQSFRIYERELAKQEVPILARIEELKNSALPEDKAELASLVEELNGIYDQRIGIEAVKAYEGKRAAVLDSAQQAQTTEQIDNILAQVNDADIAYTKAATSTDPTELAEALSVMRRTSELQAPNVNDINTGSQNEPQGKQQETQGQTQDTQGTTQSAQEQAQADAQAKAQADTQKQTADSIKESAKELEEITKRQADEERKIRQAAKASKKAKAKQVRNAAGIEEPVEPPAVPVEANTNTDVANVADNVTDITTAKKTKAKHLIGGEEVPTSGARLTRDDVVSFLSKKTNSPDVGEMFNNYVAATHTGKKPPTIKQVKDYAEAFLSLKNFEIQHQQVIDKIIKSVNKVFENFEDVDQAANFDEIMEYAQAMLAREAKGLSENDKARLTDMIADAVESRMQLHLKKAGYDFNDPNVVNELIELMNKIDTESAGTDSIKYRRDSADLLEGVPESMREELEPKLVNWYNKALVIVQDKKRKLTPAEQANALKIGLRNKKAELLGYPVEAQNARAMDTSTSTVVMDGDTIVTGREQQRQVDGTQKLGRIQRVLRPSRKGYETRLQFKDKILNEIRSAVEIARRDIWRAATQRSGGKRVAPGATLRDVDGIKVGRKEGNTSQFFIEIMDMEGKPTKHDVDYKSARAIEIQASIKKYLDNETLPNAKEKLQRAFNSIKTRYGKPVISDEVEAHINLIMDGESIFAAPEVKKRDPLPATKDSIDPEDIGDIADDARAKAITNIIRKKRAGELNQEQYMVEMQKITEMSDDDVIGYAINERELAQTATAKQPAPDDGKVNQSMLGLKRGDIATATGEVASLRDQNGGLHPISDTKTIGEQYGDKALEWEVVYTPANSGNRAAAASRARVAKESNKPVRLENLRETYVDPSDVRKISEMLVGSSYMKPSGSKVSIMDLYKAIEDMESAEWMDDLAEFDTFIKDYEELNAIFKSYTPNGVVLTKERRTTARKNLDAIFDKAPAADKAFVYKLIRNLGGDELEAPMIREGNAGSYFNRYSNEGVEIRGNTIVLGKADKEMKAFSLSHEIAHWAFRNILTPEDRAGFFKVMRDYYDGGRLAREDIGWMLPEMIPNATVSPQEFFANQFTQWLFTKNNVFSDSQTKLTLLESMKEFFKSLVTLKDDLVKLFVGKKDAKGNDTTLDDKLVSYFEQIMRSDEGIPYSKVPDPSTVKNPQSMYFVRMQDRIFELNNNLEVAVQQANPDALNQALFESARFIKWLSNPKTSRTVKLYSSDGAGHMKAHKAPKLKAVLDEYKSKRQTYDEAYTDNHADFLDDDSIYEEIDLDAPYEAPEIQSVLGSETDFATMYAANIDLIADQQLAALELQKTLDFASSIVDKRFKSIERREGKTEATTEAVVDVIERKRNNILESTKPKQLKTNKPSSAVRDDLANATSIDQIIYNASELEARGAPKMAFDEKIVLNEAKRRLLPSNRELTDQQQTILSNLFVTNQENELLSAINHRNETTAQNIRTVAWRLLNFHGLTDDGKVITNAELAAIAGVKSTNNKRADTTTPEFAAFRKYVKDRVRSANVLTSAPLTSDIRFSGILDDLGVDLPRAMRSSQSFDKIEVGFEFDALTSGKEITVSALTDLFDKHKANINPFYVKLFDKFKSMESMQDIRIQRVGVDDMASLGKDEAVAGFYNKTSQKVYLRNPARMSDTEVGLNSQDGIAVLMHELVHAATLTHNFAIDKRFDKMLKVATEHAERMGLSNEYGLTNVDEFIAEAMTNGKFQSMLREIPYENKTVWDKFVEFITDIIGLKQEDSTLLGEALSRINKLMDDNEANFLNRAVDNEYEALSKQFLDELFYVAQDLIPPSRNKYDKIKLPEAKLAGRKLSTKLLPELESEVGRELFFVGKRNLNGLSVSTIAPEAITNPKVKSMLNGVDDAIKRAYEMKEGAINDEVRNAFNERIDNLLKHRDAITSTLKVVGDTVDASPAQIKLESVFRLDDTFMYTPEEVSWLVKAAGGDLAPIADKEIVYASELKTLYGEDKLVKALKANNIDAVTTKSPTEMTLLNKAPEPVAMNVDMIQYNRPDPGIQPAPGGLAAINMISGTAERDMFSAFAAIADNLGAEPEQIKAVKKIAKGQSPNADERNVLRKLWDVGSENSIYLRKMGFDYVADFIKPENGVGVYEKHATKLAEKIMPIFNSLEKLPDASNGVKRWLQKSADIADILPAFVKNKIGLKGTQQPESFKRIVAALRRGDPSNLKSQKEIDAFDEIKYMFAEELEAMKAAGIPIGDTQYGGITGYFPQVWDTDIIASDPNAFVDAFSKWFKREAFDMGDNLTDADAYAKAKKLMDKLTDDGHGVVHQGFGYSDVIGDSFLSRVLRLTTDDLNTLGLDKFMMDDLEGIMAKYFDASTRRIEFHEKFGIRNHGYHDYMNAVTGGRNGVADLLLAKSSFNQKFKFNAPDGAVAEGVNNEVFAMPAVNYPNEAFALADKAIGIAEMKPAAIAKAEIKELITSQYDKYVGHKYHKEMVRRAEAIANAVVDGRKATITQDVINNADKIFDSAQYKSVDRHTSEITRKASKFVRSFNSVTLLAFTTVTSLADFALPLVRSGNFKAWLGGMYKYASGGPEYRSALRNIGATINTLLHDRLAHVYGADSGKFTNAFFNITMLTPWTKMMREMTTAIGYEALKADAEFAQRMVVQGKMGTRGYRLAKRRLDYFGLGDFADPRGPSFSSINDAALDNRIKYALMKFANESIFEPNNNDIPIMAQTSLGKMVYQLKSFPHMMMRNVIKAGKQNEIEKFALALGVVGPAFGAGALAANDIVRMRGGEDGRSMETRERRLSDNWSKLQPSSDEMDKFLGWYSQAFIAFGGLGLLGEIIYNTAEQADNGAYGKMRTMSMLAGPWLSTADKGYDVMAGAYSVVSGEDGNGRRRQATRTLASFVPVAGATRKFREFGADLAGEARSNRGKAKADAAGGLPIESYSLETAPIKGWGL